MARVRTSTAVVLVLLTTTACAAPGPGAPGGTAVRASDVATATPSAGTLPSDEVPPLAVEIRQSRSDQADRVVQVRVEATGGEAVVVHGARLRSPTLHAPADSDPGWSRRVPAGRAREAPVALGEPVCPAPAVTPDDVRVELTVADERGRRAVVELPVLDRTGHVARIAAEDCARAAVAEGLRASFAPGLAVTGTGRSSSATLRLVLEPVPGGPPVTVHRVDGTVLLAPREGTSWPVAEHAVAGRTVVDLPLRPARCDAHAVAEDKRGTYFPLRTSVDGVPQPAVPLGTGPELRGALHDFVALHCGW